MRNPEGEEVGKDLVDSTYANARKLGTRRVPGGERDMPQVKRVFQHFLDNLPPEGYHA
jgi:hypothetical protein